MFNPYRVSYNPDFALLSKDNPARKWKEDADKTNDGWLIVLENGIYYNPAVPEVQRMIIDGVREIVEQYEVDGVHMDDYFYPSTEEKIDQAQYDRYVKDGGQYSRAAWRRENVNTFVSGLYAAVKAIRPTVSVGISPAGDIERTGRSCMQTPPVGAGRKAMSTTSCHSFIMALKTARAPLKKLPGSGRI